MLAKILLEVAEIGRALQHSEDNIISKGSQGALETLADFKNIVTDPTKSSHKWDGQAAIFWGHDNKGQFYLIPQYQWEKGLLLDRKGLSKEIQNTGKPKKGQTDSAFKGERQQLAQDYDRLWSVFEKASEGTKGFYKGDLMFGAPIKPDQNGRYTFTGNKVTYTVEPKGLFGKMPTAVAFVAVHGKPKKLGSSSMLNPVSDKEVEMMNRTPYLIAIPKQKPEGKLDLETSKIDAAIQAIQADAKDIDGILNYVGPKFTTLRKILYDYSLAAGKNDKLSFDQWLQSSKVSPAQKQQIETLKRNPAWAKFWKAYDIVKTLKKELYQQLSQTRNVSSRLGMIATVNGQPGGEGFVTSTGKLVNPAFRSAAPNPRFQPVS
jgi:hypothetical protein